MTQRAALRAKYAKLEPKVLAWWQLNQAKGVSSVHQQSLVRVGHVAGVQMGRQARMGAPKMR